MSLEPKEVKTRKRIATMGTGTHLAMIADMFYLRDGNKDQVKTQAGHPILAVLFKNDKTNVHEQHYIIDNGIGSEAFNNMLAVAQVVPSEGDRPKKKDAMGKRLWISIREIHHINDDKKILDFEGNPIIEHYIFRVSPFINGGKRPLIVGDPLDNNGIPAGVFLDYKNFAIKQEAPKPTPPAKPQDKAPESWDEVPTF